MFLNFINFIISNFFYFALHFKGCNSFPKTLTAEEEKQCFKLLKSIDQEERKAARDKLIVHNMRLVAHIIKKYYAVCEDPEDLISIGTIGLIKSVSSYKHDKGTRFATYASKCIENAILT